MRPGINLIWTRNTHNPFNHFPNSPNQDKVLVGNDIEEHAMISEVDEVIDTEAELVSTFSNPE